MASISWTRVRHAATAGALGGLVAGLVFATAHAFIIVPIWDRMFGGLFGAAATGAVVAWAFAELNPQSTGAIQGMKFGALLWLAVAPVSLVAAGFRAAGRELPQTVEDVLAVTLALAAGALWGRLATRRTRATIATATAALALTMAMGGPVPITRSVWALGIWLAVLPASVLAGAVLAAISAQLRARNDGVSSDHPSSSGQSFRAK